MLMLVSPFPPGAQLQVRSLVFLDQQVRLTGFSGGTGTERGETRKHGEKEGRRRQSERHGWRERGVKRREGEGGERRRWREDVESLRV